MPCLLDYDMVLKLEHWYPEADYFFKKIHSKRVSHDHVRFDENFFNGKEMRTILRKNPSASSFDRWMDLALSTPKWLVDRVVEAYKMDFQLFNYDIPK